MRIDLYNSSASQATSDVSSQQVATQNAAQAAQSGQTDAEDRTTLMSDSTSVGSLVNTALSFPEVRQSTVDSLREAVNSGQYELDPAKIAASMVDDFA
jgi:flagellar biosynthesis anti-sigma factor FlgM